MGVTKLKYKIDKIKKEEHPYRRVDHILISEEDYEEIISQFPGPSIAANDDSLFICGIRVVQNKMIPQGAVMRMLKPHESTGIHETFWG